MDYTLAVGLISGMSIDGIDAALLRVYPDQPFELVALFSRPYTVSQGEQVLALCDPKTPSFEDIL